MTLAFDPIPACDSPLSRLDPRWKLAAFVPLLVLVALLRTLPTAGVACAAVGFLALLARLPWRWYLRRIGTVLLFLAPFLVVLPFLVGGSESPSRSCWQPAWPGTRLALLIGSKALALVTLVLILLATAPLPATLKAAHRLGIPGVLVQLFLLTYRYLFLLLEELRRLRIALRVRGHRLRSNRRGYQTVAHVTGTLLVRSHERGERISEAMRCRGFDGRFRALGVFHTRLVDVAAFLLLVSGGAGLLLWDLCLR
jgi:cobalt/nickel transport system permease protein